MFSTLHLGDCGSVKSLLLGLVDRKLELQVSSLSFVCTSAYSQMVSVASASMGAMLG